MPAGSPPHDRLIQSFANELPVGIWVARAPSGDLVYANRAFEEIMGMAARDDVAVGGYAQPYGIYSRGGLLYPEDRMPFVRALEERTTVVVDDLVIHRRDGGKVHVRAVARPLFGANGQPEFVVIAFIDISREVGADVARAETEARLHRAQRMESIGNLAGGIAHDFNNLLGTIQLIASRLRRHETDAQRIEDLNVISDVVDSAAQLTRALLGFAGRGKDLAERISLNNVVRSVADLAGRTLDRRVEIIVRLDADPGETIGDFSQLEQVVMNLMVNARDAMPQGGRLTLRTHDLRGGERRTGEGRDVTALAPVPYVVLEISDTGSGIPYAIRDKIFEPYFTTKNTGTQRGSGLGLATVHGIVEAHRGAIEVVDVVPRGTTMRVYLPAAPDDSDGKPVRRIGREPSGPATPGRGTVLIVDDEPLVRNASARALRSLGYQVITAADGEEAVEIFVDRHPEIGVVLLDMMMPRMDGKETFQALRAIKSDVVAVLITGHALNEEAQSILDLGVKFFLRKPCGLDVLSDAIARAMRGESA